MNCDGSVHGLVLSGGAANAAYEVGVLRGLTDGISASTGYHPLAPQVYSGTSAGAFNAALMASWPGENASDVAHWLEHVWVNMVAEHCGCGNGIYRIRGDLGDMIGCASHDFYATLAADITAVGGRWLEWARLAADGRTSTAQALLGLLDVAAYIDRSPFEELLERVLRPAAIRANPNPLRVAVTEWLSGELRIFHNRDMTDNAAKWIVTASTSIPGFFRPVQGPGEIYVDGGVVMDTPLLPAIQAGADVLHVVYADPDVRNIPIGVIDSLPGAMDRLWMVIKASVIGRDIELARRINRSLAEARRGERNRRSDGRPYRQITIHAYHPDEDTGGTAGLLDMDRGRIERLIQLGYREAAEHDCARENCLLPETAGESSWQRTA